jgi:hypothetical protein
METVDVTLDETNYIKAIDFFEHYQYQCRLDTKGIALRTYVGDRAMRKCRFCNKSEHEASFKKDAHIIPQFLGNRYLLSAFECDSCNALFGEYENAFANSLGAYRPFSMVNASKNKKFPKHKEIQKHDQDLKTRLSIQQTDLKHIQIIHEDPFEDSILFDDENNKMTIRAVRPPYIPLYAYKLLVKIGMSLLGEEELMEFEQTKIFLRDNTQNDKFRAYPLCHVYMHTLYGTPLFPNPFALLYTKKSEDLKCPAKTVILYSGNHIYQTFLPLSEKDKKLQGQIVRIMPYPLLFDKSYYKNGLRYDSFGKMFDGHMLIKGERQELGFTYQAAKYFEQG